MSEKLQEVMAQVGTISPISQAAGAVSSGWIDASKFEQFLAEISTGVLGASATVDAKLEQASDSGGTGVENITGKSITQIVKATGDNKEARISLRPEEMVGALLSFKLGTAKFFRLTLTVGTAASLVGAKIFGFRQKNDQVVNLQMNTVVQTV